MRSSLTVGIAALGLASWVTSSQATVLTFDFGGSNGSSIPSTYGNRVGNPMFPPPPGFSYGAGGGITPNVQVFYGAAGSLPRLGGEVNGMGQPVDPSRQFGDLTNVLYLDRFSLPQGILTITLVADPGFLVCLDSFQMASTYNPLTGGEDLAAKSIQVLNQGGTAVFRLDYDPANPPSTVVPGTLPLRHRTFSFNPPIISPTITIYLDLTQYISTITTKIDRIGIDNIQFTQLPAPGAAALFVGACAMLGARRRRRR